MKKVVLSVVAAVAFAAPALAADLKMPLKAPPAPASPWDFAFGDAIMTDYMFRGITQSAHRASVAAYFEPRYNFSDSLQGYLGLSSESIDFPNHAAAEVDFYGGIRPTFGKLALDFGGWYYYYPGGQCFSGGTFTGLTGAQACSSFNAGGNFQGGLLPNGNVVKADVSFFEAYAKGTYTVNELVLLRRQRVLLAQRAEFGRLGHLRGRHGQIRASEHRDASARRRGVSVR